MNYKVFVDENSHEIYAYENSNGLCFIEIKQPDSDVTGFIALDKQDLAQFINELLLIKNYMSDVK